MHACVVGLVSLVVWAILFICYISSNGGTGAGGRGLAFFCRCGVILLALLQLGLDSMQAAAASATYKAINDNMRAEMMVVLAENVSEERL